MKTEGSWAEARRVLCIRLDAMGDVLMTSPALRALKQAAPGRQLTLLTSHSGAEAARLMPFVDEIIVAEVPWMKSAEDVDHGSRLAQLVATLKQGRYDAAVIFTVYSQSSLPAATLCTLAGIPLRLAHCRENPYHLLTHWVDEPEPHRMMRHEVRRQLDLVAYAGAAGQDAPLSISIPPSVETIVAQQMHGLGTNWVTLHPGATAASRRYPTHRFVEVVRQLHETIGCHWVLTGSQEEASLAEEIMEAASVPAQSFAGKLSLPELAALIHLSPLVICNNTGPSHLAAAMGTPLVCLYALTNPQHTPWMVPSRVLFHDVPCRYCYKSVCPAGHHACLERVPSSAVVSAALGLLGKGRLPEAIPMPAMQA